MSSEETKTRVPLGSFFARLGRRVRSKSPAVSRRLSTETPKTTKHRCAHTDANGCSTNEIDCADLCHSSPHRFGSFIHRLSRRKSKKSGKTDGHFPKDEYHTLPRDIGRTSIQQTKLSTPRSAVSENDIRHVAVRRDTDVTLDSMTGVSQFMSEDNLAVVECGTPAHRVPSYIRVSCALNGYTKSPRHLDNSALRPMGLSLVERRLGLYEPTRADRKEPTNQSNKERPGDQSQIAMGASFSTLSPVKALISQFDRLHLCSTDKENVKEESCETTKSTITIQPTPVSLGSHSVEKSTKYERASGDDNEASSALPIVVELKPDVPAKRNVHSVGISNMRTGEDFAQLLESVRSRLQASIAQVQSELEEVESMPEEAESSIRIAAGKAQLLVKKKLSKFEELVKKNLNPIKGDMQPATIDDLEGYWALVEIELQDIDDCFRKVDAWRASGWNLVESAETQTFVASPNNNNIIKKKIISPHIGRAVYNDDSSTAAKLSEKQKAADALRKKTLAEVKRKQRIQQAQNKQATEKDMDAQPSDVLMIL